MPKTTLAIEAFIRAHLTELDLSDDEFLHRLGYRKLRKAREHLQHLYLGNRELDGTGAPGVAYAGPDLKYWHIAGGLARNMFGIGNTVLFAEYGEHQGGLAQNSFIGATTGTVHCSTSTVLQNCDSTVNNWGIGVVQYVDAAALELFASYKVYELDTNGFVGTHATLNSSSSGTSDFSLFMAGAKINF